MRWEFEEPQNTAVITTQKILSREHQILEVWHDVDDGMWQFLDGHEVTEKDAVIVSLREIMIIDPSINLLSNLPLGGHAWRNSISENWNFELALD